MPIFKRIFRLQLPKRIKRPILNSIKPTSQRCSNSCNIHKQRISSRILPSCRNYRQLCRTLNWHQLICSKIPDCRKSSMFLANNQVPMIWRISPSSSTHQSLQRSQANPNQRRKSTPLLPHHHPKQKKRSLRKWKSKILQKT